MNGEDVLFIGFEIVIDPALQFLVGELSLSVADDDPHNHVFFPVGPKDVGVKEVDAFEDFPEDRFCICVGGKLTCSVIAKREEEDDHLWVLH